MAKADATGGAHLGETEAGTIGFRVKSGWATAVLLAGPTDAPRAIARLVVELSDPKIPASRQPYHAATGREETDRAKVNQRVRIVKQVANRSVAELIERHRQLIGPFGTAGLVVGSLIEPEAIANPHIRAHACEGKLPIPQINKIMVLKKIYLTSAGGRLKDCYSGHNS